MNLPTNYIDLAKYKPASSTLYIGRVQGGQVRDLLELDKKDKTNQIFIFQIPNDTTSFNASFYLGMLFPSFERLGVEGFDKRYKFELNIQDPSQRAQVESDLKYNKDRAISSLKKENPFSIF